MLLCHKAYDTLSFATLVGQAQCLVHTLYATFPNNFNEISILILLHHPTPRHPDILLTPKFTCTFLYSIFAYPIQKYISSHRSRGVRWAVRFVTHSAVETHSTVIDCSGLTHGREIDTMNSMGNKKKGMERACRKVSTSNYSHRLHKQGCECRARCPQ